MIVEITFDPCELIIDIEHLDDTYVKFIGIKNKDTLITISDFKSSELLSYDHDYDYYKCIKPINCLVFDIYENLGLSIFGSLYDQISHTTKHKFIEYTISVYNNVLCIYGYFS